MEDLGAAAFWMFVAVVIAAAIWRKTTLQREALATVRLAIEKGVPFDPAVLDTVLKERPEKSSGMLTGAMTTIAAGIGLGMMGGFLKAGGEPQALFPLVGVGCLVMLIGVALLFGWWMEERRARERR